VIFLLSLSLLSPGLRGDAAELEALASLDAGKLIRAREQAQKLLSKEDSFIAHFVMAKVHHQGEGNNARARFLLEQLKARLLREHPLPLRDPEVRRWYKRILLAQEWVLADMDLREEELEIIDEHDEHFQPSRDPYRIWALVKLRRYKEARLLGERLILSDNRAVRLKAYNGLLALEDEARNRKASWEWALKATEATRRKSCVVLSNTALAARRAFRLKEALRFDQEALKAKDHDCPTSPYSQITTVQLIMGRFQQSLSALKLLQEQPREGRLRVQNEMQIKGRAVELLYALGQFKEALIRVEEIIDNPDRQGTTSVSAENFALANALLHQTVISGGLERMRERVAARKIWERFELMEELKESRLSRWEKRRMALRLAAQPRLLRDMIRPYFTDVMPWYAGEMILLFGAGLMSAAIEDARAHEPDFAPLPGAYLDALEAELAWRQGEHEEALQLSKAALQNLPKDDRLLRLRVQGFRNDIKAAGPRGWHEIMHSWPSLVRILGLSIPAWVKHDGDELAARVASRLLSSPRLHPGEAEAAFQIFISRKEKQLSLCLSAPDGFQYQCAQSESEEIPAILETFHDKIFSPKLELTQKEINSLDGAPIRLDADHAVREILGEDP